MKRHGTGAFAVGILLASPTLAAAASATWRLSSTSCPDPVSPLSQVQTDVDREIPKPMTEDMRVARLEVASAYAPQKAGNGASWCMRYEVTNNGPDPVPLFYWRLSGQKIEDLRPADGPQSTLLTLPPSAPPTPKDTVLYGFKSQSVTTKAFQSAAAATPSSLIVLVAANDNGQESGHSDASHSKRSFVLKNGDQPPEVGGEFTGAGADIGATSSVARDKDIYHFTIRIGRNNSEAAYSITAPLTLAFAKLELKELQSSSIIKEFQSSQLSLEDNEFSITRDFAAENISRVYLISQPIAFKNKNKDGICFLVPTYSPVDVSDELSVCP